MTLSMMDKLAVNAVRGHYEAPKVADLIESIDAQYGTKPDMAQVNQAFSTLAKADPAKLKNLNAVLEKNPGLADKIKNSAGRDPQNFSQNFLPAVFKNPESAVALVDQSTQTAQKPAPVTKTYDYPEAGPIAAAAKAQSGAEATAAASTSNGNPASSKPQDGGSEARLAAKMDQLSKAPGFDDLMKRVNGNDKLKAAFTAMLNNPSTGDKEGAVDDLLAQIKKKPDLLQDMVQKLDNMPGAYNTAADIIAGDPKNGIKNLMKKMDELDQLDQSGMGGLMGMFGSFMKTGKFDLGGMIGNIGGPNGGLLGMVASLIMGLVGSLWGGGHHMVIGSNVGMTQYNEVTQIMPKKPDSITVLGVDGQASSATQVAAASATQEKSKAVGGPQAPNQA